MLTVSLVGKKFSCSIQLQISTDKEGGGLELALKAGEKCNNRPQSVSNVSAALNVTIQNGCSNSVTKCKEMLMFLQEQALPKTMNIMKVHMVNKEMKNLQVKDDNRLFSCMKQKKRERERGRERSLSTDRLSSRGYSSDTEGHSCASSTGHLSRMDILATPRMARHKLKNAALLRNRRHREVSKDPSLPPEKETTKVKNQNIELQLNESCKTSKVKKVDTEFEGGLIYEGGSESSLCSDVSNGKASSKTRGKDANNYESPEDKESKNTESDMSADSLEFLDIEEEEKKNKKKKKKKPSRGEETILQADRRSRPSRTSLVPPLVFPNDSDDSTTEFSGASYTKGQQKLQGDCTKTNLISNLTLENTNQTTNTENQLEQGFKTNSISELNPEFVGAKAMQSQANQHSSCTESNLSPNVTPEGEFTRNKEHQKTHEEDSITSRHTQGKFTAADVSEILRDSAQEIVQVVIDSALKKLKDRTSGESTFGTKSHNASCANSRPSNGNDGDINARCSDEFRSLTFGKDNGESNENMMNNRTTNNSNENSNTSSVLHRSSNSLNRFNPIVNLSYSDYGQGNDNMTQHAYVSSKATQSRVTGDEIDVIDQSCTTYKEGPLCTPRSTQTSPIQEHFNFDVQKGHVENSQPSTAQKCSKDLEISTNETRRKDLKEKETKKVKTRENKNTPVRLYDSHDNITSQIINTVSRALYLDSKYVTPSSSHGIVTPDSSKLLIARNIALSRSHDLVTPDISTSHSHIWVTPNIGSPSPNNFVMSDISSHSQDFVTPSMPSLSHAFTSTDSFAYASQQYAVHKNLMSHSHAFSEKQLDLQSSRPSLQQQIGVEMQSGQHLHMGLKREKLNKEDHPANVSDSGDQDSQLIEEFCRKLPYNSQEISSKINQSKDRKISGYCFFVIGADQNSASQTKTHTTPDSKEKKDGPLLSVESIQRRRKNSMYRRSMSHQSERRKWQTIDPVTKVHHRAHSLDSKSRSARASKCVSCPVLSEEDIVLEGLESHHQDICNSLSQRTWIVLRVHELWKANKHVEALQTCMELTGVKKTDVENESMSGSLLALDMTTNKDIVLFLNILQQLQIGSSSWTLHMCDLVLPELKLFISTRIHTSHVDMTCNVLQVIVKKVSAAVLKAQTANKPKAEVVKKCVSHLQDVKERASQVLMARRPKMYSTITTEDPIALKPVLRELLTVLQTLMNVYIE